MAPVAAEDAPRPDVDCEDAPRPDLDCEDAPRPDLDCEEQLPAPEVLVEMADNEQTDPDASSAKGGLAAGEETSGRSPPRWKCPRLLGRLRDREVLQLMVYVMVTCCYYVYRSRGCPTFTNHPFQIKLNDLWGILFIVMFLVTRRASYLVYAINPFRNLLLVGLQAAFPRLQEYDVEPEFHRDVISATTQLTSALLITYAVKPKPIGSGTALANKVPFAPPCVQSWLEWLLTAAFVVSAIVMIGMGLTNHTDRYTHWFGDNHGWKIILAILLGTSEEVTWREAYLRDNNNTLQAFTWGMNHMVVGEGLSNPVVYGLISFGYAFLLGVTEYRWVRYFNHVCIEYLIMDNLIKTTALQ